MIHRAPRRDGTGSRFPARDCRCFKCSATNYEVKDYLQKKDDSKDPDVPARQRVVHPHYQLYAHQETLSLCSICIFYRSRYFGSISTMTVGVENLVACGNIRIFGVVVGVNLLLGAVFHFMPCSGLCLTDLQSRAGSFEQVLSGSSRFIIRIHLSHGTRRMAVIRRKILATPSS